MFGVVSVLCCGRQEKLRNTPLHLPRFVGVFFFGIGQVACAF